MKLQDIFILLFSVALSLSTGAMSSFFTVNAIDTWYTTLEKPFLNPPDWVFGPVWTLLYILMGIAFFLILRKGWKTKLSKAAIAFFLVQLLLNGFWSIIFFALESPGWALAEIVILWGAIWGTLLASFEISRWATYLLIPYIAWVSFAMYLNFAIWMLN